jgi:DNA-binding NarL/FixJ family response regulator
MMSEREIPLRVMVVDDHEMARAGLRALLGGLPALQVVAEAANGTDAIRLAAEAQPELLLLDIRMPGSDGFEVLRHLRAIQAKICIVIVTMHGDEEYLRRAREMGADGYVLKDASRNELLDAIEIALRQRAGIGGQHGHGFPVLRAPEERLTEREKQVLSLIVQGMTNREIGARLGIAAGTAKVHVERILSKLGVVDRTQAAVRAAALGLTFKTIR